MEREKWRSGHARLMRQAGVSRLRVPQPAGKQNRLPCQPEGKGKERCPGSRGALLPRDSPPLLSLLPLPATARGLPGFPAHFQPFSSTRSSGLLLASRSCVALFWEVVVRIWGEPFSSVNWGCSAGSFTQLHFHPLSDSVLLWHRLAQGWRS